MDKIVDVAALQPVYKQLYALLSEPALLKIYDHYRGSELSLPIHLYNRQLARKRIISQYTGSNQDELTRFYGYSQRWTSQILKDGHEEL